jgi:hypothetical protein
LGIHTSSTSTAALLYTLNPLPAALARLKSSLAFISLNKPTRILSGSAGRYRQTAFGTFVQSIRQAISVMI